MSNLHHCHGRNFKLVSVGEHSSSSTTRKKWNKMKKSGEGGKKFFNFYYNSIFKPRLTLRAGWLSSENKWKVLYSLVVRRRWCWTLFFCLCAISLFSWLSSVISTFFTTAAVCNRRENTQHNNCENCITSEMFIHSNFTVPPSARFVELKWMKNL